MASTDGIDVSVDERKASYVPPAVARQQLPCESSSLGDYVNLCILRYNLNTAVYMLDPWEMMLFNTVVLGIMAYIAYCLYYSALHPLFEHFTTPYM